MGETQEEDLSLLQISSGSHSLDRDPGGQWGKDPRGGREKEEQTPSLGEQLWNPKKCHGVPVPQF